MALSKNKCNGYFSTSLRAMPEFTLILKINIVLGVGSGPLYHTLGSGSFLSEITFDDKKELLSFFMFNT